MAIGLSTCSAVAQTDRPTGLDFVTITDPGNPGTTDEDSVVFPQPSVGSVDYVYRIGLLEVTRADYFEFLDAYWEIYFKNNPGTFKAGTDFTGWGISIQFWGITLPIFQPDRAANMGWEYAARYVNWLHHGKLTDEWAFESGVFDTSTFEQLHDGKLIQQQTKSPEARYWIPNNDEWTKAAYWDPNKDGEGIGGYWRYPNSSMNALVPDLFASEGGQRNAGDHFGERFFPLDVKQFPNERSPWGLYDLSGGEGEWQEFLSSDDPHARGVGGSVWTNPFFNEPYDNGWFDADHVTIFRLSFARSPIGLRLVSTEQHPADLNHDGHVNYFDISEFITLFTTNDSRADLRLDGVFDIDDVRVFIGLMGNEN